MPTTIPKDDAAARPQRTQENPVTQGETRFPEADAAMVIPFSLFDSHALDPAIADEAWRDNMRIFFDVQPSVEGRPTEGRRSRVCAANLGAAVLGLTEAPTQHFVRDHLLMVQEEQDLILVQFFLAGGGRIHGEERFSAGDMLVIDLSQPHRMLNDDFRNLTLLLPKSVNPELSAILVRLHGRRIPGHNPLVQMVRDHLVNLWQRMPALTPEQGVISVHATLGLLGGWLGDDPSIHEQFQAPTNQALLAAITRHIDQHLERPIEILELTQTFRISRALLYRLFQPHGGVANFIWERRLQRSLRLLISRAAIKESLSTIAYSCGFSSESHFCHRFRDRFGMAPGQARSDALEIAAQASTSPLSERDALLPFRRLIEGFAAPLDGL